MRFVTLAALMSAMLLAACGGPETSQANNSATNTGTAAVPPATANASTVVVNH